MHKSFSDQGFEDYLYWQNHDKKTLKKINDLLKDIERNGAAGAGVSVEISGASAGASPRLSPGSGTAGAAKADEAARQSAAAARRRARFCGRLWMALCFMMIAPSFFRA